MTARGAIQFSDNGGGDYTANASGLGQVIPDNNLSGVAYALNFSHAGLSVANVTVTFNISGGRNGDLYAYLSNGSTTLVLLNRVGTPGNTFGYADAGFSGVLLSDSGPGGNIHNYGGNGGSAVSGSYTPDSGSLTFGSAFGGSDPSANNWTLFFADESGGSVSTLNSFNVDITAVPEPVNMALGIFGGLTGVGVVARTFKKVKMM